MESVVKSKIKKANVLITASIISVIVGVVISLLVPKILADGTLENLEYAQYRKYLFYLPFLCFFHIGFVNGTFVRISNSKNLTDEDLKKQYVGSFYIFFFLQALFSLLFGVVDYFFLKQAFKWIVISLFFYNVEAFFVKLLNSRLHVYALSIYEIFNKLFILSVVLLMFFGVLPKSAELLICLNIVMHALVAIALTIFFGKIIFCKFDIKQSFKQFFSSIKIGIPLLVSYFVVLLIVGAASIIIEYDFKTDYSNYQFVYSLMGLATGLLSYFNGLILPLINRIDERKVEGCYHILLSFVFLLVGILLCLSPIIKPILSTFFNEYLNSHSIFVLSIPVLGFQVFYYSVFYSFYQYKLFQNRLMIINSVAALIIIGFLKIVSFAFKTHFAVLIAYAILLFAWFVVLSLGLRWNGKKQIIIELVSALLLTAFSPILMLIEIHKESFFVLASIIFGIVVMTPSGYYLLNYLRKKNEIIS